MGVPQLNIKDAETVRMARDLADASGQSVTATVRAGLEVLADRRKADEEAWLARVDAIVAEFQKHMPAEWEGKSSKEIMDSIYNADGSFA